jgi:hypothetical protein
VWRDESTRWVSDEGVRCFLGADFQPRAAAGAPDNCADRIALRFVNGRYSCSILNVFVNSSKVFFFIWSKYRGEQLSIGERTAAFNRNNPSYFRNLEQ